MRKSCISAVVFIAVAVCCVTGVFAGWVVSNRLPENANDAFAYIYYDRADGGFATFREALEDWKKKGNARELPYVGLRHDFNNPDFQSEVFDALEKIAPRQFAEAKKSAGNMHNPKMLALRDFFKQAVLATPTVQNINAELLPFGICLANVSSEKLELIRDNDQLRFRYIYLSVGVGEGNAPPARAVGVTEGTGNPIVVAARGQVGKTLAYDSGYVRLAYPMGDIPIERGVCTDVVVRALRDALKMDLQQLVHEDMTAAFSVYPNNWGLKNPDRNIDHRRVPNLRKYFERKGFSIKVTKTPEAYQPGDLVTCTVGGNRPHIMIVSDRKTAQGVPLVIHNIGCGTQEEDCLFAFPITGHYRVKQSGR